MTLSVDHFSGKTMSSPCICCWGYIDCFVSPVAISHVQKVTTTSPRRYYMPLLLVLLLQ